MKSMILSAVLIASAFTGFKVLAFDETAKAGQCFPAEERENISCSPTGKRPVLDQESGKVCCPQDAGDLDNGGGKFHPRDN